MKKILLIVMLVFLVACSSGSDKESSVSLNANYRDDLIASGLFASDANFLDEPTLESLKIKVEDFEFVDIYTANSADDASLFIVALAKDDKLADCKGQIAYYLENRLSAYKDYNPEAAEMIDNALEADFDNYIIRVISSDNELAKSLIIK